MLAAQTEIHQYSQAKSNTACSRRCLPERGLRFVISKHSFRGCDALAAAPTCNLVAHPVHQRLQAVDLALLLSDLPGCAVEVSEQAVVLALCGSKFTAMLLNERQPAVIGVVSLILRLRRNLPSLDHLRS